MGGGSGQLEAGPTQTFSAFPSNTLLRKLPETPLHPKSEGQGGHRVPVRTAAPAHRPGWLALVLLAPGVGGSGPTSAQALACVAGLDECAPAKGVSGG